jgi:hypothetical protein
VLEASFQWTRAAKNMGLSAEAIVIAGGIVNLVGKLNQQLKNGVKCLG